MNAKSQITAKPKAIPKAMPNGVTIPDGAFMLPVFGNLAAIAAAANSDLFDDWEPTLLEIVRVDELSWDEETPEIKEIPNLEEAWSRVEDIWLRLARHPAIAFATLMDAEQGDQLVMFHPKGGAMDLEGGRLLEMAEYSETYQWQEEGHQGSLVSQVAWCGDTLVIDLKPLEQMQAWPGGESLVWQVQGLLGRLRELGDLSDLGGRA